MSCRTILLLCLALIAGPLGAAPQSATVKDWAFKNYGNGSAEAWTRNDSGSSLGVYCDGKESCIAYVTTARMASSTTS